MTRPAWMDRWPRCHPHPERAWTVSSAGRYGSLEPETGRVWPAVPRRDRRLPGLAAALDGGAALIGYRVGRRAVLRNEDRWIKVVRPSRVDSLLLAHRFAADTAFGYDVPKVLAADHDGRVTLSPLHGRSLHDIIATEPNAAAGLLPLVAEAMAGLHRCGSIGSAGDRHPDTTGRLPRRRLDPPARSVRLVERAEPAVLGRFRFGADCLPPLIGGTPAVVHGDLHDKNILISSAVGGEIGRRVGLIDLDGLGRGCAEDDVANLAAHLEWRTLQAGTMMAPPWGEQLIAAYPGRLDAERLAAARCHVYFRLAVLYRFRWPGRHMSDELYRRAMMRWSWPSQLTASSSPSASTPKLVT